MLCMVACPGLPSLSSIQVHEVRKRVLGAEHPSTLTSAASNLATFLADHGKYAEAQPSRCCMLRLPMFNSSVHRSSAYSALNFSRALWRL